MKYTEFKSLKEKGVNDFPMFFAFSQKQLDEGIKKFNISKDNKMVSIGMGGYIQSKDKADYIKLMEAVDTTTNKFLRKKSQLIDALVYELGNHEYCVTGDLLPTLDCLGIKSNKLNDMQKRAIKEAKQIYYENREGSN